MERYLCIPSAGVLPYNPRFIDRNTRRSSLCFRCEHTLPNYNTYSFITETISRRTTTAKILRQSVLESRRELPMEHIGS